MKLKNLRHMDKVWEACRVALHRQLASISYAAWILRMLCVLCQSPAGFLRSFWRGMRHVVHLALMVNQEGYRYMLCHPAGVLIASSDCKLEWPLVKLTYLQV